MIDLKTFNTDWLYPDGHAESFQAGVGHSYGSQTYGTDGARIPDDWATAYRYGVANVTGEQLIDRDIDTAGDAYAAGQADAKQRLADGARLIHFGADHIMTHREFSAEYRARLEQAVVSLSGQDGPFDNNGRYEFGIIPEGEFAGRAYSDYGSTLVWQLSRSTRTCLSRRCGRKPRGGRTTRPC